MQALSIMTDLATFGAAGLMGAMWLWERKLSRDRETQLTCAHERILRDEERLSKITEVVEHNTAAITRFAEAQRELSRSIREVLQEVRHAQNR